MDIKKIRTLIELMEEKELVTLEVCSGDDKVSLTRYYEPTPTVVASPQPSTNMVSEATTSNAVPQPTGSVESSPMVGVFYSAPSPNDPPFVQVGQKVQAGDTLGIIEAMKIMNPLEATQSGVIEEILVKNGDVVEFGQPVIRYKS
ncbi:acetyl-CoA carboxylase biotin carboxyl carrier protein [Psychrobacter sp. HD31]|uniref:acetyl-CoA carboxylase biotin carboxyl carrier protein n=1 Tax=Psychrobacter sp. HD31 TaxID=3112003 RepID=UPI003DA5519C